MVSRAPYLLNFSVKRLDNRLRFYQEQLSLSAYNVSIFKGCSSNWNGNVIGLKIISIFLSPDTEHCGSST